MLSNARNAREVTHSIYNIKGNYSFYNIKANYSFYNIKANYSFYNIKANYSFYSVDVKLMQQQIKTTRGMTCT